jgi:NitT/TauT family transport system permease protein
MQMRVSGKSSIWTDLPVGLAALALFYGLLSLARYWTAPVNTQARIDLSPAALPIYALFSVARIAVAYGLSLAVSLIYGYVAARHSRAERFMIPLLDTLQSIPVLCFLPGVMLSMAALFPTTQFGLELGSILLIFTGQVWNMAFSVYSSLKSIPRELLEAARLYQLSWWQRFIQLELPHTTIGLLWNSMMSVAGGWFSLMVCEMFVLGNRDLRLPGLGSYLQSASNAGATGAIVSGLITMIVVIVLIDQLVWRPLIAWSEKFKFEQVEASQIPVSPVLNFLRRSQLLSRAGRLSIAPAHEVLMLYFARARASAGSNDDKQVFRKRISRLFLWSAVALIVYPIGKMGAMLTA